VAILRRKAAAGVSAALLHFADACCAASVAVPPVWPAGKGPRDFGLDPRRAARGRPSARRDHPAAAGDPCTGRPDPGCCWRGARGRKGVWAAREHQRRTRQRRTRPDRGTGQEVAWHTAVIPPAGPGVRRSDSRGPAIRFARCWVLPPRGRYADATGRW